VALDRLLLGAGAIYQIVCVSRSVSSFLAAQSNFRVVCQRQILFSCHCSLALSHPHPESSSQVWLTAYQNHSSQRELATSFQTTITLIPTTISEQHCWLNRQSDHQHTVRLTRRLYCLSDRLQQRYGEGKSSLQLFTSATTLGQLSFFSRPTYCSCANKASSRKRLF
jgi:hypothetical protein